MARQAELLNRVEEDLPSTSDIAKADDMERQEITENASQEALRISSSNSRMNPPMTYQYENSYIWRDSSGVIGVHSRWKL